MKIFFGVLALCLATCTTLHAAPTPSSVSHSAFDALLREHVSSTGAVDYPALKKDLPKLKAYLDHLQAHPPAPSWSRDEQLAYWINAYNAHTLYLVASKYFIYSITDIYGGDVWNRVKLKVGGGAYTLNQIEKNILVKRLKEPRVHFAINCAAKSCPPLLNRAWKASTMQADLEARTRSFLNDRTHNRITASRLELSKIFEWYAADFGDVRAFVNRYTAVKVRPNASITYREYDWQLNK